MVCGGRNTTCNATVMAMEMGIETSERYYNGRALSIEGNTRIELGITPNGA